jgi:hypothetical protein
MIINFLNIFLLNMNFFIIFALFLKTLQQEAPSTPAKFPYVYISDFTIYFFTKDVILPTNDYIKNAVLRSKGRTFYDWNKKRFLDVYDEVCPPTRTSQKSSIKYPCKTLMKQLGENQYIQYGLKKLAKFEDRCCKLNDYPLQKRDFLQVKDWKQNFELDGKQTDFYLVEDGETKLGFGFYTEAPNKPAYFTMYYNEMEQGITQAMKVFENLQTPSTLPDLYFVTPEECKYLTLAACPAE